MRPDPIVGDTVRLKWGKVDWTVFATGKTNAGYDYAKLQRRTRPRSYWVSSRRVYRTIFKRLGEWDNMVIVNGSS